MPPLYLQGLLSNKLKTAIACVGWWGLMAIGCHTADSPKLSTISPPEDSRSNQTEPIGASGNAPTYSVPQAAFMRPGSPSDDLTGTDAPLNPSQEQMAMRKGSPPGCCDRPQLDFAQAPSLAREAESTTVMQGLEPTAAGESRPGQNKDLPSPPQNTFQEIRQGYAPPELRTGEFRTEQLLQQALSAARLEELKFAEVHINEDLQVANILRTEVATLDAKQKPHESIDIQATLMRASGARTSTPGSEASARSEQMKTDLPGDARLPSSKSQSSQISLNLNAIDQLVKNMPLAQVAFNAPENMALDETKDIQLALSLKDTIEELKQSVMAHHAQSPIEGGSVKVTDRMEARLTGDGFQISAVTPEQQIVAPSETTTWRWLVKASQPGEHELHLTVAAFIETKNNVTPFVVRTFDRTIRVEVSWTHKIAGIAQDNWQWLWTAILVPLGAWLVKRFRKASPQGGEMD